MNILKRRGPKTNPEEHQKHEPEISGWVGNCETSLHSHQKAQNTKLMKKKRMWNKIECITEIEINGISLSL
jgi:hypothetical protein